MTREQTIEAIRIMQAWVGGKEVECADVENPRWGPTIMPAWNWSDYIYRIKSTAKLRPWIADEVPLGAWLRYKGNPQSIRLLIVSNTECGLVGYQTNWPYKTLLQEMEHSTDGGKTWLPCGVMEESK